MDRKKLAFKEFAKLKYNFRSTLPISIKTRLYLSILRPMTLYGHEYFHSKISTEQMEKFERYWIRSSEGMWKASRAGIYNKVPITPICEQSKKKYIVSEKKIVKANLPQQMNPRLLRHNLPRTTSHELS